MADAPVAYVTVQPDALFDGLRRNIFHLRGYAPQAARGVVPRTPLFPQFAISNPLRLSRIALRLAPADLLTGLSIRTVHRTVLISGPHAAGGFSTVRNIKSASSLAHSASTCAGRFAHWPLDSHRSLDGAHLGPPPTSCWRDSR